MRITLGLIVLTVISTSCRNWGQELMHLENGKPVVTNDTKELRTRDSLVSIIESIQFKKPRDLNTTVLTIETYGHKDMLKLTETKFWKARSTLRQRLPHPRYKRRFEKNFFSQYHWEKRFKRCRNSDRPITSKYRYIVKTTAKTTVTSDSVNRIFGVQTTRLYYLYDQIDKVVIGEIKDLLGGSYN